MKKIFAMAVLSITVLLNEGFIYATTSSSTILEVKDSVVNEKAQEIEEIQETEEMQDTQEIQEAQPEGVASEMPQDQSGAGEYIKGDQIVLSVGSKQAYINGKPYSLDAPALIVNGSAYVPLRFVVDKVLQAELNLNKETGMIVITKEGSEIKLSKTGSVAYINGEKFKLSAPPIVKNGVTYLPLRFMSEQFHLITEYDKANKKITLLGPDKGPNTKPIASFRFTQDSYVVGQPARAINTSYDPDGHKLVGKLWSVMGNKIITNTELSNMFKKPDPGVYTIGLKVQDQYGLWSDWTYQDITILPNKAPTITYLGAEKTSYQQGETIKYQFFFENEPWEEITNEKWTYRKANEDPKLAILGKPTALFTEGDYIITLQLDDAYGNRSEVVETLVHITDQVMKKELEYRFTQGNIGDIIDNYQGFNFRDYVDVKNIQKTIVAGTMIMSDSPETVTREGILYRDTIKGKGRVLLHHSNEFSEMSTAGGNKRLVLVVENTSDKPVTLTLSNKSIKGPIVDVAALGQKVLADYLRGSASEVIKLAPGERRYIYDTKDKWARGTSVSGLMDVHTTGEVTFTAAAVSAGNTINNMHSMELFFKTVHPRGTFDTIAMKYSIVLDGSEPEKLVIGGSEEEWVKGYDALSKEPAQNKGNFGISYYITITAKEDMGIILNPRATTFKGAVKWEGMGVYNVPTVGTIYGSITKAVSLGTIKKGATKTIEYMLPNGSSAPVLLGFVPKAEWSK